MTDNNTELDKAIRKCFTDTQIENDDELTLFDTDKTIENIKDYILSHYIAKSEVEEIIGADEELPVVYFDEIEQQNVRDYDSEITLRNSLRAEQRLKLRGNVTTETPKDNMLQGDIK